MKLYRFILPFFSSLLLAYAIGVWMDFRYRERWSSLFFNMSDELISSHTKYDMILLGNSRVHFGINPYYLDSASGLSAYNFANGGADVNDILLTSKLYLEHHPIPKIVLISVDPGMLKKMESLQTLYHYLFYLKDTIMRRFMKDAGHPVTLIRLFPFLKYALMNEYNRTSIFVKPPNYPVFDHNIYRGYLNISKDTGIQNQDLFNTNRYIDDSIWEPSIGQFDELINLWQKNAVQVIFTYPPENPNSPFKSWKYYIKGMGIFDSLAKSNHIPAFHFENDKDFVTGYFVDEIHLNNPGSTLYSIKLGDSVRRFMGSN
ncbi:MAG: hypothetical protein KIS82_11675 [Ferruginibacter sp.]|nr:hypothetical protein [Ferruginibacter sp.]